MNPEGLNDVVTVPGITATELHLEDGTYIISGGYLDVGIIDTMKI